MQESRMIAEVAPPGVCAMPKVSGSRIATPFAPPRPGSTPMITPRMTPVNMSARLVGVSATANPCASAWISSISEAEHRLERAFRQRHEEPPFEDEVEHGDRRRAYRADLPPRVPAQPAHEEADEEERRLVDADPGNCGHIEHRRHQHREHELELPDV